MPKQANTGFYARFLGGFFLEFEGRRIIISKNMKQKNMQILMILLKAGQKGVTRRELTEMLEWRGENWEQNLNNLRRQNCILRRTISEAGFPEGEYIRSIKGRYYFSLDYPVETDTGRIDQLYQEARKQADGEERENTLKEICRIYQGEFMPFLVAEEWALVENAHYHSIYSRCVHELCRIFKGRGDYEELLRLCTAASQIHPYDEWQAVQIDCLMADNRYQDARQVSRKANAFFSRELGITPFQRGGKEADSETDDKSILQDDEAMEKIMTGLLEEGEPEGAYQCNYLQFIDVYRFLMRVSERGQIRLSLLLCTLKPASREETTFSGVQMFSERQNVSGVEAFSERQTVSGVEAFSEEQIVSEEQMERFGMLLAKSIRDNDVYTRYSLNQYLVLLASSRENHETGVSREREVTRRLLRDWKIFEEEEGVRVVLEIQALEAPSRKEVI